MLISARKKAKQTRSVKSLPHYKKNNKALALNEVCFATMGEQMSI
jgi:hypothetical protein